MAFEPFSKSHIQEMIDRELSKLDVDYTPENSYWVLENKEKDRELVTDSWVKAMWFEELLNRRVVDGRVSIITFDPEE